MAALAEMSLERCELVETGRDDHHAGGDVPVRPVQRIDGCPPESRYDPAKMGTVRARSPACARRKTAGAALGSIIAAIIVTHRTTKEPREPSRIATNTSMPCICRVATTQETAASPSIPTTKTLEDVDRPAGDGR